jgi:hypothetical protein
MKATVKKIEVFHFFSKTINHNKKKKIIII